MVAGGWRWGNSVCVYCCRATGNARAAGGGRRRRTADGGRRDGGGGRRTADGGRRTADGGMVAADGGRRTAGWWRRGERRRAREPELEVEEAFAQIRDHLV
jgi:hypothetical protein